MKIPVYVSSANTVKRDAIAEVLSQYFHASMHTILNEQVADVQPFTYEGTLACLRRRHESAKASCPDQPKFYLISVENGVIVQPDGRYDDICLTMISYFDGEYYESVSDKDKLMRISIAPDIASKVMSRAKLNEDGTALDITFGSCYETEYGLDPSNWMGNRQEQVAQSVEIALKELYRGLYTFTDDTVYRGENVLTYRSNLLTFQCHIWHEVVIDLNNEFDPRSVYDLNMFNCMLRLLADHLQSRELWRLCERAGNLAGNLGSPNPSCFIG
jgi:non-canonical (house-cleaning) NTP pyrophosphatase